MALLFFTVHLILDVLAPSECGWKWVFLTKWLLSNLIVLTPCDWQCQGVVTYCRCWNYSVEWIFLARSTDHGSHHGCQHFCAVQFSLCSATGGDAVTFFNVAPHWLHCKNRKQLCVGSNIWESNVGFEGGGKVSWDWDEEFECSSKCVWYIIWIKLICVG
jgi:hypothetical protein